MPKSVIEEIFLDSQAYMEKIKPSEDYKKVSDESYEFYCNLKAKLNGEQIKILENFADSRIGEITESSLTHFVEGFKLGLRLGVECMN